MTEPRAEAALLTDVMLAVFRVNGRLLEKGDQLVAPLNLTSARWQVLGAVVFAEMPVSAPHVAEAMGVTRQGAQKQLNRLEAEGFVQRQPNPRHERSPLYAATALGAHTISRTMELQQEWATRLAAGLSRRDLDSALKVLNALYEHLDSPVPVRPSSGRADPRPR